MVKHMHREIRSALDKIEEITLKETKETLSNLQVSLNTYADTCIRIHIELKHLHEALEYSNIINQTKLSFITRWKCTEIIKQVESDLNENLVKLESSLLNQTIKDTQQHLYKLSRLWRSVENVEAERNQYNSDIYQYLSRLSGLGSIVLNNYAFSVKGKSEYNMRKSRDLDRCWISGICTLPNGHTLVADWTNNKVKLLDQHCKVLSYCSVANFPRDICPITVSKTVVTVNDDDRNRHDAQFIKVKKGKLMTGRKIQLQHVCKGIAHHQGDLFITSDTAVYKYTLDGNLVSKLYEDTSDSRTGMKMY
ncbi:hypothetical protein DPMN_094373 [Dreissena polymorpha]|uniref:Uncharacterized protein n=1 Tax=Dreissena polymorpha TaxID=45954 RepID=A0A9D4L5D8_DREPO|nr:hypothetical protein DPMN_094373 [Dreissena polymorpha]